ncbi:hypothetical protein [Streptomyces sp. H27-C3]|uniref:hypothetical protein n=1 Tax=Streptomyces sp. H27-C3 TaxID=3046305 RepID=UPI0024BB93A7|nr:hypothetical protein [Streptomyces sp. H27-C3]MDJ0466226.1 hypothetical protein [Streptomyces sp. H27-C3]
MFWARVVLGSALSPKPLAGVRHANHPEPVTSSALLEAVAEHLRLPADHRRELDVAAARVRLATEPRALKIPDMLTTDHWFADDGIRQDLCLDPGPGQPTSVAQTPSRPASSASVAGRSKRALLREFQSADERDADVGSGGGVGGASAGGDRADQADRCGEARGCGRAGRRRAAG